MSARSDKYLKDVPTKPYDLLREGLIVFGILAVVIFVLAGVFGSPDYPTVRAEDVAKIQPVAFLKTSAEILDGQSSIQDYGPPYTNNPENAQKIFGMAPANWLGVTNPINASDDLVLKPLERAAYLNANIADALPVFQSADLDLRHKWLSAYLDALDKATVVDGKVEVPSGDYGPVEAMMDGMLDLGRAGLLEGALESGDRLPYTLDSTRALLFFQDDVDHGVAESLDMLGEQWGIDHETGEYPGAWWLWPYTLIYQIPVLSASPNVDLLAVFITTVLFGVLLFMPFIPILNRVPKWIGIYKIIWRDWYGG